MGIVEIPEEFPAFDALGEGGGSGGAQDWGECGHELGVALYAEPVVDQVPGKFEDTALDCFVVLIFGKCAF